jgi:hypothetical protein
MSPRDHEPDHAASPIVHSAAGLLDTPGPASLPWAASATHFEEGGFTVEGTAKKIRVRLDWSRMLGFDQVQRSPEGIEAPRLAKVGSKPSVHGSSLHRLGSRIGLKPGIKLNVDC